MSDISDAEIIAKYPIGTELDQFCCLLQSKCDKLGISGIQDHESRMDKLVQSPGMLIEEYLNEHLLTLLEVKDLVFEVLLVLQRTPLARQLPSRSGCGTLRGDLSKLLSHVDFDKFDTARFYSLLVHIDSHASGVIIWAEIFTLLSSDTSTAPTLLDQPYFNRPLKSNSSSQQDSEQTHNDMDERILQEINGRLYKDTGGFYEKYFEGKGWSSEARRIIKRVNPRMRSGRWGDYPMNPTEDVFLDWFKKFHTKFFLSGHSVFYASPDLPLAGSDCKRKPDLFVAPLKISRQDGKYNWTDVRVIGVLRTSQIRGEYVEELMKLSEHAREVFAAQPTRRFLHGFIIRGSIMELWVFDRSGLYGSESFAIHEDPRQFVKIMFGYMRMSDEELGVNTYIEEDKIGKYIVLKEKDKGKSKKKERLYLEDKPIASQRAIVCRGTTCYRAKSLNSDRWEYVVKFAWRSDKRKAEGELLKLAKERDVWGVAKLIGHQDLEEVAELRRGLIFSKPQKFRSARRDLINQNRSSQSTMTAGWGISPKSLSTSSLGQKRRMTDEEVMAPPPKRSNSGTPGRSNIANLSTAQMNSTTSSGSEQHQVNSLMTRDDGLFENRIFSCLVISPPGRAIQNFDTLVEFLESCRDFIKAQRSLYRDGKILHRDISENNLIITDAMQKGDPKGTLIDLDLAQELDGGSSGARHRTGTMEFMAIEVLEGEAHTYRHDLESFLYVFLWVVVLGRDRLFSTTSRLRRWYLGGYDQIADSKRAHMDKQAFKRILLEFPSEFEGLKGLAEELRDLLFPIHEGAMFVGTYSNPERLYRPMIEAFNQAIARHQQ